MSVQYKGVNLAGLEFGEGDRINYDYVLPGQENYEYWSQDVGSNVIRLPFMWERLQPDAYGELDQEYLGYLKDSVSWAKANGMTIALDLHNFARYDGQLVGSDQLTDVWGKLSQEFGGDNAVWFNLMNEPYHVSADQWADVTQETVNALRAEGVENKLLLSGTSWSGAHSWISSGNASAYEDFTDPINNFAFDVHQYLDGDSSGTSGDATPGAGSTRLVDVTQWAQDQGVELFLGEAGVSDDPQCIKEMSDMMQFMENHSEVWLGWTLWGAGPWWGDYYLEINPQGSEHDPAIDALMEYMEPGGSQTDGPRDDGSQDGSQDSQDSEEGPQEDQQETEEPQEPDEPVAGETFDAFSKNDNFIGTDGDDTVYAYESQLNPGDKIALGEGYDTLVMTSYRYTFDSSLYRKLSGIDHLDMSVPGERATIILDEDFMRSTDAGEITITFGDEGPVTLDTSKLAEGSYTVDWQGESVTVALSDAPDQPEDPDTATPGADDPVTDDPDNNDSDTGYPGTKDPETGDPGTGDPDTDEPAPQPEEAVKPEPADYGDQAGVDEDIYSGSTTVTGTADNDIVRAWDGQLDPGDIAELGEGFDTLYLRSYSPEFNSNDFPGFTGIDHIDVTAAGGESKIILGEKFLSESDNGQVTLSFGRGDIGLLDTSALDHETKDVFLYGEGNVYLGSGDDEVTVIGGESVHVNGGGGDDAIFGDTADDVLYGGDGMDFLYGHDGNDILAGGAGADLLNGGDGADVFRYTDIGDAGDLIQGFGGGDALDLNELLASNGMGSVDSAIADGSVNVSQNGPNVEVSFNVEGAGAVILATVENADAGDMAFTGSTIA
jgi:endoglucanase